VASKASRRAQPTPAAQDLAIAEQLFRGGDHEGAEKYLQKVLARQSRNSRANELLAYIAGNRGDYEGALRLLSTATADAGASPSSWYYLGVALQKLGRFGEALKAVERSLAIGGEYFEGLHDLGLCLLNLGDPGRAVVAFDKAIAMKPASFEAHYNRGRALDELRYFEDALAAYDRALELAPGDARIWSNRGGALHDLGRLDEALASLDKALAVDPGHAYAWTSRGIVLQDLERFEEALESFRRACEIEPAKAEFRHNESLFRLLVGDLEHGFPLFEARFGLESAVPSRHVDLPRWSGERAVGGKCILVWTEQGFGDAIQFCRYAPLLAREGAQVIVEVEPALRGLAGSLEGCRVIDQGSELPECDLQVPMLSLPAAFGTRLDSVPREVPYLKADPDKVAIWRERLGPPHGRLRVGISCSGNPAQRNDRNRSAPLEEFGALRDSAELFLVQKGVRRADEAFLLEAKDIRYLGDDIADFGDTAAILANMDLVICVDSSVAHLAGALGRPLWILLTRAADWRWLVERTDCPWYPTARLFRQTQAGDWKGVMSRVREALAAR
jgi:tetratricopeptide (TPR) repeat protein